MSEQSLLIESKKSIVATVPKRQPRAETVAIATCVNIEQQKIDAAIEQVHKFGQGVIKAIEDRAKLDKIAALDAEYRALGGPSCEALIMCSAALASQALLAPLPESAAGARERQLTLAG